jgi:hypothetical protein
MPSRLVQLLDLTDGFASGKDGTLTRNLQPVDRGEMCYYATPMEFPAYLRFWRRVSKVARSKTRDEYAHLGTTMELDVFQFGVKVYARWDMPDAEGNTKLKIIIEDQEGLTTVAEYERR